MDLLLATNNKHKVEEITGIIGHLLSDNVSIKTLADFPFLSKVDETEPTLEGNALKKAREIHQATGMLTLADDTGLEVYYLELQPGVYSARYAGEHATYHDNNVKLLWAMKGVPPRKRNARFRCVVGIIGKGIEHTVEGRVEGTILESPRGTMGFGYDPLFVPASQTKTYAEMDISEKNRLSHRFRAFENAAMYLQTVLK